jgi:hypothetical protein
MTQVTATGTAPMPGVEPATELLTPCSAALDPLAMLLTMVDDMSQASLDQTERRLQDTREKLHQRVEEFLEQVAAAIQAAEEAAARAAEEEDDGGWFDDVCEVVSDAVGFVAGTVVDFSKDLVEAPFEIAVGLATNVTNPSAMMGVLQQQFAELSTNGETADTVKGFAKGVVNFSADFAEFMAKAHLALRHLGDGQRLWDAWKQDAEQLWKSFEKNIADNPDFMTVAQTLAKAAAVAGAVASGGTLAWVAVGAFLLCEADNQYGFIEDVVGKDAAPWVRLGLATGTAILLGVAGGGDLGAVSRLLQGGTAVLAGIGQISRAIRAMDEGDARADAIEREAAIKQSLNRMQRLQRLVDALVEQLEEQSDSRKRMKSLGNQLVQTQAAAHGAVVMRA